MGNPIRIVQVGLGPLGQMLMPYLAERPGLEIVGAMDIDADKVGQDLGTLCSMRSPIGTTVTDDFDQALAGDPQVAVVTTVSELDGVKPLLEELIQRRVSTVSTCEELSYPWKTHPDLSAEIDAQAKAQGVSVLGTGVNPGFLMDFLPTAATAVCRSVRTIRIERIQDASFRRLPFQEKIGAGLSPDEFASRVAQRKIRHVGLTESMHMVASMLGWDLDRTEDVVEPVIAESDITASGRTIKAGMATGVNQTGRGFASGEEVLTLVFRAAVGQEDPMDRVWIEGEPELDLRIPGGTNGDIATCSIVTNAIPAVLRAQAGLRTMVDIPPISCSA
ncbi:MAG: dihydrodipicolinate reductase [Candidatus Latescibacteria bacterium]|nr:dihydrodipicolinate reductase [Candidatus Latescibacterota bacterium]